MAEEGRGYRDLLAPFADDVGRASGRCMQMPVLIVQISKLIARRGAGDVEMDNADSSRWASFTLAGGAIKSLCSLLLVSIDIEIPARDADESGIAVMSFMDVKGAQGKHQSPSLSYARLLYSCPTPGKSFSSDSI
jgi:hypothetical protein